MAIGESTTYPKDSEVLPPSKQVKWSADREKRDRDREHFWTNWRVSSKKTLKLCMPSANYALMANFISETWDRF